MTNLSGANLNNGAAVGPQGEGRDSPSTFPKYPAYKDSGVEWLGDVPGHWNISPLKFSASCNDTVLPDSTDGDYEIEYVEISDVNEISGITGSTSYKFADAPSRARRMLQDGDVLVSTVRTYLRAIAPVVAPPENLIASTGFAVVRPRKGILDGAFLGYMLRAEWWISEVIARSVGVSYPAINASDLIGLNVPVPAWHEQTQIARFLDHETARIDALIEEQQRLIELLKEKRQAVISHAVTKGLDPTVPMKDSGVEWLGEVPAHWTIKKGGHIGVLFGSEAVPEDMVNDYGNLPFLKVGSLSADTLSIRQWDFFVDESIERSYRPKNRFIVFPKRGAAIFLNKVNVVEVSALLDPNLMGWEMQAGNNAYYFANVLKCRGLSELADVSTVPQINNKHISPEKFPVPPYAEQNGIVAFLDTEISRFDQLVTEAEHGVSLLQERRSSLISAAVTGKIDVRGWQPPFSTQAPELEVAEAV